MRLDRAALRTFTTQHNSLSYLEVFIFKIDRAWRDLRQIMAVGLPLQKMQRACPKPTASATLDVSPSADVGRKAACFACDTGHRHAERAETRNPNPTVYSSTNRGLGPSLAVRTIARAPGFPVPPIDLLSLAHTSLLLLLESLRFVCDVHRACDQATKCKCSTPAWQGRATNKY